jgi:hypothetical protein
MKILKCKLCRGEVDITNSNGSIKHTKCKKCGCSTEEQQKGPEVVIIRKRAIK